MKDQLKTIREFVESVHEGEWLPYVDRANTIAALTQLEVMAEQEPVAEWIKSPLGDFPTLAWKPGYVAAGKLYAAPVAPPAQQYEAGDVASAAAQGFRDGVASVTQQEPVAWAMPKGDGTFIDVITPAEHAREEGSYTVPLFAHPVAQQPQAEAVPNVCASFYTESAELIGTTEAPIKRVEREDDGTLHVYIDHWPQQAEAAPSSGLNPDESDPVTLWAEIWRLREAVKGPDGYATWQDAATAERIRRVRAESKQAEEAKAVPTHDDTDLIKQMLEALRSCSGVSHWPALIPAINAARKRLEATQRAEAVPSAVVRDALELAEEALGWHASGFCADSMPQLTVEALHAIRAAFAQQKGQP